MPRFIGQTGARAKIMSHSEELRPRDHLALLYFALIVIAAAGR